ncbi:hypothetical protein CPB86DRAFT_872322 [Serendipita vermifera]|nr:hypothetical protein CPB86DRAFT_872322 [Serendipita vermifera]
MAMNSRDSINLTRILKRLENSESPAPTLVQAENVKYARTLAKRIYGSESNPYEQRLNAVEHRLDGSSVTSSFRRKPPTVRSFTAMIEPIVIPSDKELTAEAPPPEQVDEKTSPTVDEDPAAIVSRMLLPSEELSPPKIAAPPTLLPTSPSAVPPAKATAISSDFLSTSRQTQEDISQRLAEMATQLRRNAQHFSAALEDDKDALAEADAKIDANLSVMQKERGRLGTYSSKSRGTTWLVVSAILVVAVSWVVMFFVIRVT